MGSATKRAVQLSLISGGLALLAGCGSYPESHVVSAPPPPAPQTTQVVVTQPQATVPVQTATGTVVVTQAPPAMQTETITAQPTSDHKWIPGYWTWRNSRYEWISGHWELPPYRNSVWVAPRWERTDSGGYRFFEGYWN